MSINEDFIWLFKVLVILITFITLFASFFMEKKCIIKDKTSKQFFFLSETYKYKGMLVSGPFQSLNNKGETLTHLSRVRTRGKNAKEQRRC